MVEGDQGHKPGPSLSPLAMEIESEGLGAAADDDDGRSSRCGSCRGDWFAMLEEQQRPGLQRAVPQVPAFHKRSPRASCDIAVLWSVQCRPLQRRGTRRRWLLFGYEKLNRFEASLSCFVLSF
ncbi:unnamed protein product [Caretta caretta]